MKKTKEQYLAMGMDEKMAEYFATGKRLLKSVTPMSDYTLTLFYENEPQRIYDMKPVIKESNVLSFLNQWERFRGVYLDDCHCVCWDKDPSVDSEVVWNNKIDFCPDTMYVDSIPISD